jgi:hypothetical protein
MKRHTSRDNRAFQTGSCLRKTRYATYADAVKMAGRFKRHTGDQMRVYRCAFCRGYHMTHEEHRS